MDEGREKGTGLFLADYNVHSFAGPFCLLHSPTSSATRKRLTQLYAATVAVISTTSLSLKCFFSFWKTSSETCTSSVMASVYANTAACFSSWMPSFTCLDSEWSIASTCSGEMFGAERRMGECASHSYQALFSTATRHMAVSRMEVGRLVEVRIAPRKEFLWMLE